MSDIIALSQFSVFQFLSSDVTGDLNTDQLHIFNFQRANQTDYHFVGADSSNVDVNDLSTREFQFSPSENNISLNPTPAFYPEFEISPTYYEDTEVGHFLNPENPITELPSMEYKQCRMHFASGFVMNVDQPGVTLVMYVLVDGRRVYLTSIYENYIDSSLKVTESPIIQEGVIYDQSMDFLIPDLDFMFNSTDPIIVELREKIFGDSMPRTIFFEYSTLTPENIDTFSLNGRTYQQINRSNINTTQTDISAEDLDLFTNLKVIDGYYFRSELSHTRYDIESYLNKLKDDTATYTIDHTYIVTTFDENNNPTILDTISLRNVLNVFTPINYRPIINSDVDHFSVDLTIKVSNSTNNVTISKSASVVVTDVSKFLTTDSGLEFNLTTDKIYNNITEEINQIQLEDDTPKILRIEKPIYVIQEIQLDTLTLIPKNFTAKLSSSVSVDGSSKVYLQIGSLTFESNENDSLTFHITKQAYFNEDKKYFLVDEFGETINYGNISRD